MKAWESELADDYSAMTRKWKELAHPHTILQLGTLGTGNHFIEVCIQIDGPAPDADDPRIWVMLHSVHFAGRVCSPARAQSMPKKA